jgi:hypothetical protein
LLHDAGVAPDQRPFRSFFTVSPRLIAADTGGIGLPGEADSLRMMQSATEATGTIGTPMVII